MAKPQERSRDRDQDITRPITFGEKIRAYLVVVQLPFRILTSLLIHLTSPRPQHLHRPLKRIAFNAAARFVTGSTTWRQMQYLVPGTRETYIGWVGRRGEEVEIDELQGGEGGALLWVGGKERGRGRVLVYCHGGAFVTPLSDAQLDMCVLIQREFAKKYSGEEISVVVLEYSLYPSSFPTQLTQLTFGIRHLLSQGYTPPSIHLLGDSAGSNIILQLLSHTLHPFAHPTLSSSPLLGLPPLGSALFISPWTSLSRAATGNGDTDVVSSHTFHTWGSAYASRAPPEARVYVEASDAPAGWFDGIGGLVRKVLVTAGGGEVLRRDIEALGGVLRGAHGEVNVWVGEGALHDDPLFDIAAGVEGVNLTTGVVVDWLVGVCRV